jgi:threonine dehydrogenase-like Zn-dependent dehydrogenase
MTMMQASVLRAVHDRTSGRVALEPLVTARYPLSDVAHALTAGTSDPSTVKVVVTPTS